MNVTVRQPVINYSFPGMQGPEGTKSELSSFPYNPRRPHSYAQPVSEGKADDSNTTTSSQKDSAGE